MKYYNIDGSLDCDLIENFIEFINGTEDSIKVYISTSGGYSDVYRKLLDIFNNDDRIVKVIYNWQVSSNGFRLMVNTNPDKRVIGDDVYSCLHLINREVNTNDLRNKNKYATLLNNNLDKDNEVLLSMYRNIGINEELIEEIKNGEDVYLSYDDIMKLNI